MQRRHRRGLHRRSGDGLQVRHRNIAFVLRLGSGLHDADALDRERLRQPLGDGEADRLPALPVQVVTVEVGDGAVAVSYLQARPRAGAVRAHVQGEGQGLALHRDRLVRHQVEAARRGRRGEVVGHADRTAGLTVRALRRGDLTGRTGGLRGEGRGIGEVQNLADLGAEGEGDSRAQLAHTEGHRAALALTGGTHLPRAQAVIGHGEASLHLDLDVRALNAGPLPIGVIAGQRQLRDLLRIGQVHRPFARAHPDRLPEDPQLSAVLMGPNRIGHGAGAGRGARHADAGLSGLGQLKGPGGGELARRHQRIQVRAQAGARQRAVQAREHRILALEREVQLHIGQLLSGGVGVEHEGVRNLAHLPVRRRVPHLLALRTGGAGHHRGGAAAIEVHGVVGAHVRQQLRQIRQRHPGGSVAAPIEHQHEQLGAVPADTHRGAGMHTGRQRVIAQVRHLPVHEDLVGSGDAEVHVLIGADRDIHGFADGQGGDLLGARLPADQQLPVRRDLRVTGALLHGRDRGDDAIDHGRDRDLLRELIGGADGPIQRVLAPRRGVHADAVLRQRRIVHTLQRPHGPVGQRQLPGGGERLDRGTAIGQGQGGHRLGGAHSHTLRGDGRVDRSVGMVDVEEGAVHGGDGLLPARTRAHHILQRGAAGDGSVIDHVHAQRLLGEIRGEDAALHPAAILEPRERGEVQARRHPVGIRLPQHTAARQLLIGDLRARRSESEGRQRRRQQQRERRDQGQQARLRRDSAGKRRGRSGGEGADGIARRRGRGGGAHTVTGQLGHNGFRLAGEERDPTTLRAVRHAAAACR